MLCMAEETNPHWFIATNPSIPELTSEPSKKNMRSLKPRQRTKSIVDSAPPIVNDATQKLQPDN